MLKNPSERVCVCVCARRVYVCVCVCVRVCVCVCQFVCAWIRGLLGVRRRRAPQVYLCTCVSGKITPGISDLMRQNAEMRLGIDVKAHAHTQVKAFHTTSEICSD